MIFYVIGSSGLVGGALTKNLKLLGYEVFKVSRSTDNLKNNEIYIEDLINITHLPNQSSAIINCGYNFKDLEQSNTNSNYQFAKKIISLYKKSNIQYLINISSLSSYNLCESKYGKIKLEIEKLYLSNGCSSIRLGLIKTIHQKTLLNIFYFIRRVMPIRLIINNTFGYQYISDLEKFSHDIEKIINLNIDIHSYHNGTGYTINDLLFPKFYLIKININIDNIIAIFKFIEIFAKLRFGSDSLIGLKHSNTIIGK